MPKSKDRHIGKRESVWFDWPEHEEMLKAMALIKCDNKSDFIRTAVYNFGRELFLSHNKRKENNENN